MTEGLRTNKSVTLLSRVSKVSTGEGTTPTLALCDGNSTCSLGLMVPRKTPVPYAVSCKSWVTLHANDPQVMVSRRLRHW